MSLGWGTPSLAKLVFGWCPKTNAFSIVHATFFLHWKGPLSRPPFPMSMFLCPSFGFQISKSCSGTCWGGLERESSLTVNCCAERAVFVCAQQFGLEAFAWVMGVCARHKQTYEFFHVRARFPLAPLQATLEDTGNFHMMKTRPMYLLCVLPNTLARFVAVSMFRARPAQLCLQGDGNHGNAPPARANFAKCLTALLARQQWPRSSLPAELGLVVTDTCDTSNTDCEEEDKAVEIYRQLMHRYEESSSMSLQLDQLCRPHLPQCEWKYRSWG